MGKGFAVLEVDPEFKALIRPLRKDDKERYGKNIPLEETVVSPQAVFDAPQLTTVAKEWPLFSW